MDLLDSKIFGGTLVLSIGVAMLLSNLPTIHDGFGTFVAIFFTLYGLIEFVRKIETHKNQVISYLSLFFIGLSLLALEFSLLPWNFISAIFLLLISLGIAYLIHGTIIKYSVREFFFGFILILIGAIIFIPKILNIEDIFWLNIKTYIVPLLFIIGGLFILLPWRKK